MYLLLYMFMSLFTTFVIHLCVLLYHFIFVYLTQRPHGAQTNIYIVPIQLQ